MTIIFIWLMKMEHVVPKILKWIIWAKSSRWFVFYFTRYTYTLCHFCVVFKGMLTFFFSPNMMPTPSGQKLITFLINRFSKIHIQTSMELTFWTCFTCLYSQESPCWLSCRWDLTPWINDQSDLFGRLLGPCKSWYLFLSLF